MVECKHSVMESVFLRGGALGHRCVKCGYECRDTWQGD
jgi:hypothetical protein